MELHTGQVKSYFSQCMPLYDEIISSFSSKGKFLQTTINKIFNPVYKRYSVSEYNYKKEQEINGHFIKINTFLFNA